MKKNFPALLLLFLVAGGFIFGIFYLFKVRFEIGDVYPPYSSLRSDPLGTMALCESLQKLHGLSIRRDFSAGERLPDGRSTTYLHLGARLEDWRALSPELAKELRRFIIEGGRLTVTFLPETDLTSFSRRTAPLTNAPPTTPGKAKSGGKKKPAPAPASTPERVSFEDQFGVAFRFVPLAADLGDGHEPASVVNLSDLPLPRELHWHSGMVFTNVSNAWRAIYARGSNAVLIERKLGAGTFVIATDSYFLSNEALLKERQPTLLVWLLGPSQHIMFDESHFGIVEDPGVAGLMRKYKLHGLGVGLLILAALFVWQSATSFVPRAQPNTQAPSATGREASAGLVNLLRRNIAPKDLLNVCFREWTKSLLQDRAHTIARVDKAQALVEAERKKALRSQNPVAAYRDICTTLQLGRPTSQAGTNHHL